MPTFWQLNNSNKVISVRFRVSFSNEEVVTNKGSFFQPIQVE